MNAVRNWVSVCAVFAGLLAFPARALASERARAETVKTLLRVELLKHYPGARIDLLAPPRTVKGGELSSPGQATYLGDNSRGEAFMKLTEVRDSKIIEQEILVPFAAWKRALIAQRRLRPGERLSAEIFSAQEVNFAISPHRDVRGLILPADTDVSKLEANQTLLEGQYPLASAVRRVPDVQRGEALKVRILSGGLTLTTTGSAEEPGSIGQALRVISGKTKRQLVGKLLADHSVEVSL